MTDWGKSGRRNEYTFHLVDPFTLQETGELIDVDAASSSITWGWDTENGYSGSIRAENSVHKDKLVRVRHSSTVDGVSTIVTLGTFFVDESPASALYGRVTRDMSVFSTMWRFTQDSLENDFVRAKGLNVVEAIRSLVETDGGLLLVKDGVDTEKNFGNAIWIEIAQNKADTIRKIASWIGCIVHPDEDGYIVIEPYVNPSEVAVKYEFEAGANCVYVPGVEVTDTSAKAVNRVVAWWSRKSIPKTAQKDANGKLVKDKDGNTVYKNDDPYGLSDYACVDLPETHSFSYERVGRRKTHVIKLSEACSNEELVSKATQYLNENCGNTRYYEIEHVSVPNLKAGDVVRYVNNDDYSEPIDCKCQVMEISMTLDKAALCRTKLREVVA